MCALLATLLAGTTIATDKETPYATYDNNTYNDGNTPHHYILPIRYHRSSVIWYATHATSHATAVLYIAEPTAHFQFSSEPIAIIVAKQGI